MPTIATLFLIAILSMLAALAHAAPPQTDAQLRAAWNRANDICIGRPDGPACAQRNASSKNCSGAVGMSRFEASGTRSAR